MIDNNVPFHKASIGPKEKDAVSAVLDSGWLTSGPATKVFERNFAKVAQSDYALAVNSCTAAMHLALEAMGVGPGDEVIVPTMTFAATAEVVVQLGAKPVFIDCYPDSLCMDTSKLQDMCLDKVKVIIPVHYAGNICDMDTINNIANIHNIYVLEDAAHCIPGLYNNDVVGSLSDATAFSFYATKCITTGEGGMLTTNNKRINDRCRQMMLHGLSLDAYHRYTKGGSYDYEVVSPGFKYNMTDMASAMGICQLEDANDNFKKRKSIAAWYNKLLYDVQEVGLPVISMNSSSYHLYYIFLDLVKLGISRKEFTGRLGELGVSTSVHFKPLHMHKYYKDRYNYSDDRYPVAMNAYRSMLSLPIYPSMTTHEINYVVSSIIGVITSCLADMEL